MMGVILTYPGPSSLFIPRWPLPENLTDFPILCITNYLYIPLSQYWLN